MVLAINIRILLGPELGRSKPGQVKSQIEPVQIGHGSLVEHGQIIRFVCSQIVGCHSQLALFLYRQHTPAKGHAPHGQPSSYEKR